MGSQQQRNWYENFCRVKQAKYCLGQKIRQDLQGRERWAKEVDRKLRWTIDTYKRAAKWNQGSFVKQG